MNNSNAFSGCKTIGDLYKVFNRHIDSPDLYEEVSFDTATNDELERLADVFEANVSTVDMPDTPLDISGFNHIKDFVNAKVNDVIDNIETENMEDSVMKDKTNATKTNINVEDEAMKKAMNEMNQRSGIRQLVKGAKVKLVKSVVSGANKTKEQDIDENQESVNTVMGAAVTIATKTADFLGYNTLKDDLLGIIEAGGESKDLFRMAEEFRKRVDAEVELLIAWGDEESLKKAMELKAETEDERGKSFIESLVAGLIWAAKWLAKKLRQWFQVENEKSVIGAICRSLSGFVSVLREGVKLAWNTAKYILSFPAAVLIRVGQWIVNAIKSLFEKAKGWFQKKDEVIAEEELEDIEEFEDEDIEAKEEEMYDNILESQRNN